MRTALKDLPEAINKWGWQDAIVGWWIELPRRWRYRWWWKGLFLEPGQGWLRWGLDKREESGGFYQPPEPYVVAPPLRRLCMAVRYRAIWPFEMKDPERLT